MDSLMPSDWRDLLPLLTPSEHAELDALLSAPQRWSPLPGPQTRALESTADVLLYGGAAGGGKTDLALGKALTKHRRTLILRREYPQLKGIIERAREVYSAFGSWNGKDSIWRCRFGGLSRVIELGSCQYDDDKTNYQGRPHDLLVFDEAVNFLESQVRFLCGWVRTEIERQLCQVLLCSNPPTAPEGRWLIEWFAPWLDDKHPHPAAPGELRYFAGIDGKDVEVGGPAPIPHKGELIIPQSRTYIPARVTDNPYYMRTGYVAQLQALPEPLRSMMLKGDFSAANEDAAFQVIPSEWVRAAQERWKTRPAPKTEMTAVGVDVARGGKDSTVLSPRHDNWFAQQVVVPGSATPDGPKTAMLVVENHKDNAIVNVDVIGVGASGYDHLVTALGDLVVPMNGSEASTRRDGSGRFGFLNKRAEWWWTMREALDPASGEDLALPPDPLLLADLCAPTWKLSARGIQVEAKDDIIARLGRSPDRGDAAVYSHANAELHEPMKRPPPPFGTAAAYAAEAAAMEAAEEAAHQREQSELNDREWWDQG